MKCKNCGYLYDETAIYANAIFCSGECYNDYHSQARNLTDLYIRGLFLKQGIDSPSLFQIEERRMILKLNRTIHAKHREALTQGDNGCADDVLPGIDTNGCHGQENAINNQQGKGNSYDCNGYASRANNGTKEIRGRTTINKSGDTSHEKSEENRIMETNPFQILSDKLDDIIKRLDALTRHGGTAKMLPNEPNLISFPEFCKAENISRQTGYNWEKQGLIRRVKVGGRQYVELDSIITTKKYFRKVL